MQSLINFGLYIDDIRGAVRIDVTSGGAGGRQVRNLEIIDFEIVVIPSEANRSGRRDGSALADIIIRPLDHQAVVIVKGNRHRAARVVLNCGRNVLPSIGTPIVRHIRGQFVIRPSVVGPAGAFLFQHRRMVAAVDARIVELKFALVAQKNMNTIPSHRGR